MGRVKLIVEPRHAEIGVGATTRERDYGCIWNARVPARAPLRIDKGGHE